jgi:RNA polymerase sigma factor (sigma-70 family)
MVLDVCRALLGNEADVEDAFQATFLIAARRASSIRKTESPGSWLHGVAYRTALKARARAALRRKHETRAPERQVPPSDELSWREARQIVHEELNALPERLRAPLVHCYLEGATQDEAALRLGVAKSTLRVRMERARSVLRARLIRRGLGPAAVMAIAAWPLTSSAAVPQAILVSAAIAAMESANGPATTTLVSSEVAALVNGVSRAMLTIRVKAILLVALSIGIVGAGVCAALLQANVFAQQPAENRTANADAPAAKPNVAGAPRGDGANKDAAEVTGRVVDPDGKPIAGASLWIWTYDGKKTDVPRARSEEDGRFRLSVSAQERSKYAQIVASFESYGPAWAKVGPSAALNDLLLRLVKDDVALEGRVLDLEGKPIANASVQPFTLCDADQAILDDWIRTLRQSTAEAFARQNVLQQKQIGVAENPAPGLASGVKTDKAGRFKIAGLGRERLVRLRIRKSGIATADIEVVTRRMPTVHSPPDPFGHYGGRTVHGAAFDFAVAPGRQFEGLVIDKATGKPVANVIVRPHSYMEQARTDENGRYRLDGLPAREQALVAIPPPDSPYFVRSLKAGGNADQKSCTANFELHSGVWITGTITEAHSGKPIEAEIDYRHHAGNVEKDRIPGYVQRGPGDAYSPASSGRDGKFKVLGSPGKGYLLVRADVRKYATADFVDWQGDVPSPKPKPLIPSSPVELALNYNAVYSVTVDPNEPHEHVIRLEPGVSLRGVLVAPNGELLSGASMSDPMAGYQVPMQSLPTAGFVITRFNPVWPRPMLFIQGQKKLGLLFHPDANAVGPVARRQSSAPDADKAEPLRVELQPLATVTGRILDADGQPIANTSLMLQMNLKDQLKLSVDSPVHRGLKTDADGRFSIDNLVAGLTYTLRWPTESGWHMFSVEAGEVKDLGDVRRQPK